ncbi:MAG: hypothetical protein JO248_19555 [Acidimicrobiia bacterium]|nr:hypothetical protein [Acidimicrobiia bacterium]
MGHDGSGRRGRRTRCHRDGNAGGAGLLVTTDGARTWTETLHRDNSGGDNWGDLGFESQSTGVAIFGPEEAWAAQQGSAPSFGGGTLYRTTDGGVMWSKVSFSA